MKRFLALALCAIVLVCTFTIVGFAEETEAVEQVTVAEPTVTETIVDYVKGHIEEISVILTLIVTVLLNAKRHGLLTTSIGTLNNNSVSIAQSALAEVTRVSTVVGEYTEKIEAFLAEFRANAEDKENLTSMLEKADAFIESAKLANKELADEVASLLVLANIPNSVKDELMSKHIAAVHAIEAVEHTEVIHHDGEEA
jgi:hypothetical protein